MEEPDGKGGKASIRGFRVGSNVGVMMATMADGGMVFVGGV